MIRRIRPIALIGFLSALLCGCFEFDTLRIEETSPYILERNGVEPTNHIKEVDLSSNGGKVVFKIKEYGDYNEDQILYHRMVIDYSVLTSNNGADSVVATIPEEVEPYRRNEIQYVFPSCEVIQKYNYDLDGKYLTVYFVLADEAFLDRNTTFTERTFEQAFQTISKDEFRTDTVNWTLVFSGKCVDSHHSSSAPIPLDGDQAP